MFIKISLILLTSNAIFSNCANILFVTPIPSPSHHVLHRTLALELVQRGHNVTILTHETEKKDLPKNLTVITMKGIYEKRNERNDVIKIINGGVMEVIQGWSDLNLMVAEFDQSTEGFKTLWNYPEDFKFDLIIYDSTIGRFMYIFTERFKNPPSVSLIPFLLPVPILLSDGGFPFTVYDPYYNTRFTDNMSLMERIYNIYYTYYDVWYNLYVHQPREDAIVAKYYPKIESTLEELEKKVSLILCNTDPVLDYPKITPPNIITVGGLHAKPPLPLPQDLQQIMDAAKSGVILFSLGTNVRSDKLKPFIIKSLLTAFAKLQQTVIWKFESDLDEVPKNVIIRKWLPQNDIMGHPNTKLFINHGGALSTQEALYHGLPIISIPFYADQHTNALKVTSKQIGLMLDKDNLSGEVMKEAIEKILNTDTYTKNMKSLSAKFRDQPLSPLEKAIFWVEYMIRHGDADHLSPPTRHLPIYKIFHFDIIGIFLSGFIFIVIVIIFFVRYAYIKLCSNKKSKKKLKEF